MSCQPDEIICPTESAWCAVLHPELHHAELYHAVHAELCHAVHAELCCVGCAAPLPEDFRTALAACQMECPSDWL